MHWLQQSIILTTKEIPGNQNRPFVSPVEQTVATNALPALSSPGIWNFFKTHPQQ
jgi:hypothetical protein